LPGAVLLIELVANARSFAGDFIFPADDANLADLCGTFDAHAGIARFREFLIVSTAVVTIVEASAEEGRGSEKPKDEPQRLLPLLWKSIRVQKHHSRPRFADVGTASQLRPHRFCVA
jgi:hypothetical protein